MFRRTTALIASATLALCLAGTALAASTAWIRVINVKTDNVAAYLQRTRDRPAMMKQLGINTQLHVYRAAFAGAERRLDRRDAGVCELGRLRRRPGGDRGRS